MNFQKRGRIRLPKAEYQELLLQVYERDDWACRRCGRRQNLAAHHILKRSNLRLDISSNLLTLCATCHEMVERHRLIVIGADANLPASDPDGIKFRLPST